MYQDHEIKIYRMPLQSFDIDMPSLPSAQKNRFLRAPGPASVNSTVKASSLLIAMCLIYLLNVQLYRGRFKKKCKFTFSPKKAPH